MSKHQHPPKDQPDTQPTGDGVAKQAYARTTPNNEPMEREIMNPETPPKPKGLPDAQVAKVRELVNYQDGAVVSREIVKKPTGGVTIFAFDEGQGLSEHTAPFDALVQVLEGAAEIMISSQPHQLQCGEMILMPAGQPHALKALARFKMILTMIRS